MGVSSHRLRPEAGLDGLGEVDVGRSAAALELLVLLLLRRPAGVAGEQGGGLSKRGRRWRPFL